MQLSRIFLKMLSILTVNKNGINKLFGIGSRDSLTRLGRPIDGFYFNAVFICKIQHRYAWPVHISPPRRRVIRRANCTCGRL
jgi:hypothetical protein